MKKKLPQKWVQKVTQTSNAMDIKPGLFTGSSYEVARDLKKAALASNRTKRTKFQSAMSMLNFYINRAGNKLSETDKNRLEQAKQDLRKLFKK
jgi:molecular chaperone DnaK (HSP70)